MSSMPYPDAPVPFVPRATLGTYDDYTRAQQVVDTLSDRGFPVENVAIVGSDLRLVETVTGRLTIARAALLGAGGGAWWGLFVGLLLALFTPGFWGIVIWGVVIGAIFGAGFGAAAHAASGGRRDFSSVRQLTATRFEVLVPSELVDRARGLIGTTTETVTSTTPARPA